MDVPLEATACRDDHVVAHPSARRSEITLRQGH
jgi:hypothetical protein